MAQICLKRAIIGARSYKFVTSGFGLCNSVRTVSVKTTDFRKEGNRNVNISNSYCTQNTFRHRKHVPTDDLDDKISVDKTLFRLMEKMELERAADLVIECAMANTTKRLPNGTTMVELLRLLSEVGDIDNILRIQDIALQQKILTKRHIFPWSAEGFFNSGRIDESIDKIKEIYNENKKYEDIDILFSKVAHKIIAIFPEKQHLLYDFAQYCYEDNDPKLYAALWKCLMMAEYFDDADKLQQTMPELKPHIGVMVNEICQNRDGVELNEFKVLKKILDVPGLKQKMTAFVYELLLDKLCFVYDWEETLNILKKAKNMNVKLHRFKVQNYLERLSGHNNSGNERTTIVELEAWADTLD